CVPRSDFHVPRCGEACVQEHHLSVNRTARYFTLGSRSRGVAEVWFACHGYGQLAARFLEKLRVLDDGRRYLVAPEGLSRFYLSESPTERRGGASCMTRADPLASSSLRQRVAPSDSRSDRTGTAPPARRDNDAHRRARAASPGIAPRAGRIHDTQTRPRQPPPSSYPRRSSVPCDSPKGDVPAHVPPPTGNAEVGRRNRAATFRVSHSPFRVQVTRIVTTSCGSATNRTVLPRPSSTRATDSRSSARTRWALFTVSPNRHAPAAFRSVAL